MQKLVIRGGRQLSGTVRAGGAKNAVLKLMVATLLGEGIYTFGDVPRIKDVFTMIGVLEHLGAKVDFQKNLTVEIQRLTGEAPLKLVREMRASIQLLGPLLAKVGWVRIASPGGCNTFGERPIDLHLENLRKLGAHIEVDQEKDIITGHAHKLVGADINLSFPSVGATENIMMAATLAEGTTVITNAAREPEIEEAQNFLNAMGAKISGAGSRQIIIHGVKKLSQATHRVIPDRIEAGTYLIAGAITGSEITVDNVVPAHLAALLDYFTQANIPFEIRENAITVKPSPQIQAIDVQTKPYPGFPTDLQPQIVSLLALAHGRSHIWETVYEDRFRYVKELQRMGAQIESKKGQAEIQGAQRLLGAKVHATDLRAGAALVLAGLAAGGITEVTGLEHIDRGYERLVEKLRGIGGNIQREQ